MTNEISKHFRPTHTRTNNGSSECSHVTRHVIRTSSVVVVWWAGPSGQCGTLRPSHSCGIMVAFSQLEEREERRRKE